MKDMQIVPVRKNVEAQYVELRVPLYSHGCERKVRKALSHLKGRYIYSVNVDFAQQKVVVWGICNKFDVLSTMKEKRKGSCFWNQEENLGLKSQLEVEDIKPITTSQNLRHPQRSRSFNLTKARSLGLKAWKKVFNKSFSFSGAEFDTN